MMIQLTKETMEKLFLEYLGDIFSHPEIISAGVRDIMITRETLQEAGVKAFEAGFHDICSDVDLSVKVRLPQDGTITPADYIKSVERFGVTEDTALGWMLIPAHPMYRIIFKNGMRYDLGFAFEYEGTDPLVLDPYPCEAENPNWPMDNINRFWFIQIQALGKLYRKDHLISSHLANMNCNDTLVMQMVLRDLEHGTNHHRYGYAEELEYTKYLGKSPYKTEDTTFDRIADLLYAAALSYDRLAKQFYPAYRDRSDDYFAIWDRYESYRKQGLQQ